MKATREESRAMAAEYEAKEARRAALASARDEVVRAAVALDAAFTDHETPTDVWSLVAARKLAWDEFRAAVAALAKLEGK